MKTTFGIIIFLILLIGYIFFINEKSEYIAGEYRYYTLYEEYKAKEKYVDYTAHSYEIDTYNLKMVKNNIIEDNEKLEKYRLKLNSYNDSINLAENTVNDYERYILNLKKLKIHIEDHKKNIKNYQTDLIELNNYILKFERDLVSIDMYKSDISNINSVLKSIDSTTNKYNLSLELIKYIASSKGLALYEEIKKQNEIERENLLAKIETEREIERETEQNNRYSEYSNSLNNSNRYISNYSNY